MITWLHRHGKHRYGKHRYGKHKKCCILHGATWRLKRVCRMYAGISVTVLRYVEYDLCGPPDNEQTAVCLSRNCTSRTSRLFCRFLLCDMFSQRLLYPRHLEIGVVEFHCWVLRPHVPHEKTFSCVRLLTADDMTIKLLSLRIIMSPHMPLEVFGISKRLRRAACELTVVWVSSDQGGV
jgi:hypothetical protein